MEYLSNQNGFLGIDNKFNFKEKVVIVPFGLEKTVSYGSGTKNGPKEIIKASHQVELYDEELNCEPYKKIGIKTYKPFKIDKNINKALKKMSKNSEIKDEPWLFRTYAGHSSAQESNNLFRNNLEKGQTGLSVAFDLPTQTGYDSDHPLANGEVGKVGVPICHLGDMRRLFDKIPIEKMNTSMTINATAPWLLALYIAIAEGREIDISDLKGTVQNDIIKEYLSRGTYILSLIHI